MIEYLYDALRSPYGVVVETSDVELFRQKLYALRRQHAPEFDVLALKLSPLNPTGEVWIIKKRPDDAETS